MRERCEGVELVIASDVDNPLLGLRGATNVYGPQKGVAEDRKQHVDAQLERFAELHRPQVADGKGAGAAGGLGFALLLAGATRVGRRRRGRRRPSAGRHCRAVDLVVTGEGAFDFQSRSGKVPYGVAAVAGKAIRPCIALAGQVLVGSREMRALGVESAYSMVDLVGGGRRPAGAAQQPGRAGRAGGAHLVTLSRHTPGRR